MKKWMVALAVLLAMPATAFAQEADVMAAEEATAAVQAEIKATGAEFAATLNGDDPAAAVNYYTDDAVVMPPNMDALSGSEAIVGFFGQGMGGATVALDPWEVHSRGDVALETGGYTITAADGSHLDHGKYVAAWMQTDDGWKMKYDIWNTSMPPAPDHGDE